MSAHPSFLHDVCPECRDLRTWGCPAGPAQVLRRIHEMLALLEVGFREEQLSDADRARGFALWSELAPEHLTETVVTNGIREPVEMRSELAIRCGRCGTEFRQGWTFERGNESWSIRATVVGNTARPR